MTYLCPHKQNILNDIKFKSYKKSLIHTLTYTYKHRIKCNEKIYWTNLFTQKNIFLHIQTKLIPYTHKKRDAYIKTHTNKQKNT